MTKHIADATSSWRTRTGLALVLLVALLGSVIALRNDARADIPSTVVSIDDNVVSPAPAGTVITYLVVTDVTGAVGGITTNTTLSFTVDSANLVNYVENSATGPWDTTECSYIAPTVTCVDATGPVVDSTVSVSFTIVPGGDGDVDPPTACSVFDGGDGVANCVAGASITPIAITAGATGEAAATNVIGDDHVFTFTLQPGFTCASDVDDSVTRECVAADFTGAGAALITAGPTVTDATLANASTVTVTVSSAAPASADLTLNYRFEGDPVSALDDIDGLTVTSEKDFLSIADFLGEAVVNHVDIDQGSENEAGNPNGRLEDDFEDLDDAIGSFHAACVFDSPLVAADNAFIEWNIEDTELNPTVSLFDELSGDDFSELGGIDVGDVPCARWASAAVGDQEISATYDPDGDGPIDGEAILFDGIQSEGAEQPLVKEWNSIDSTIIVAVSGVVDGDGEQSISGNTLELSNFGNVTDSSTNCGRDKDNSGTFWCGARANQDGTTVSVAGTLSEDGLVNANGRSFIEYTLGSHTTHYNGPIDGAETTFTISGSCGSARIEDPQDGSVFVISNDGDDDVTVLSSNYGIGFTIFPTDDGEPADADNADCQPGDDLTITITTGQQVVLTSAEDTAAPETVSVNFFAQQLAKQPLLAWAGQRIVLPHEWGDSFGCFAGDFDVAQYEIESGSGAFVQDSHLGLPDGDEVFNASLGGVTDPDDFNFDALFNECVSIAIYEQEFQGQVDIKANLIDCTGFDGDFQFADNCVATGVVHNFLVYYMEFEDITLGVVGGERSFHNNGPFDATGDPWDETTDTATATANVSADVLLRARVRGWFKTDSLDTSGTNRPALDGKPSGRHVMPDDWLLLAGGATAPLFRPNYDTMLTPGGAYACGAPEACASSTVFGAAVSTIPNAPVVGPFSLLDPGPGTNSAEFGFDDEDGDTSDARETFLPDGMINKWDAPMPPALVTFSYVNEVGTVAAATSSGFLKDADKFSEIYGGQNPYYHQAIPESPVLNPQNYLWDSWGDDFNAGDDDDDGYYAFWESVLDNRFPGSAAQSAHINSSVLAAIRAYVNSIDTNANAARIKNVYSDNHGEAMVFANGDFRLAFTDCETNVIGGGKHCALDDVVGTSSIFAVADYPDFKKKPQIASTPVDLTWTWGGYKEVTIEDGETDQFKYIVFRALDRDGFCNLPFVQEFQFDTAVDTVGGGDNNGALKPVWLTLAVGGTKTFTNTGIPSLVNPSVSLHPVLSSLDDDQVILDLPFGIDPVESVDFTIDAGEGIILGTSGGSLDATKRFASGVPTFSTQLNTTLKEFAPLNGGSDECQAWIRVSNSLLGILDVLVTAHDDEGDIINDVIVDFQDTFDYTLSFRWSLITWVGPDNIPVTDALGGTGANEEGNDITAQVTAVYGWDQAAQQWLGFFPTGVDVPGANDLTALETGQAYWIAIVGPGSVTWTVATDVGP
ncbi:MAG: hypothetical protein WD557_03675 [Dehalococcoidia bacterium]